MKKQFYITIELDTAQPEAIATVMNFDIQGRFAADDLLRQHRFDITPSYFKLNYSLMSSIYIIRYTSKSCKRYRRFSRK